MPVAVAALASVLSSCGSKDFNEQMAGVLVTAQPIKLEGEQVVLSEDQVGCGVKNDLWEAPVIQGKSSFAHLLQKGRDLKFSDDVVVMEKGSSVSYVQVRGDIQVEVRPPFDIRDDGPDAKLVTVKLGALMQHSCFSSSLPIMGVRKGEFTPEASPLLRYTREGTQWMFQKLVH
jgi:hypothetical protein